jgi:hypothetical protein
LVISNNNFVIGTVFSFSSILVIINAECSTVKLHSEELYNLYLSPDIIRHIKSRQMRWAGHVARMKEERKLFKVLVGKHEGKRPLGRPRRRWQDGISMYLREIGLGGVDWIRLAQDRDQWQAVVSAVMNLWVLVPQS